MFALTQGCPYALTAFPDVCITPFPAPAPPAPVPYLNSGIPSIASGTSKVVFAVGTPMFTTQSYVPMTIGDQPGQNGGVLSGCTGGKIDFPVGSRVVRIEGKGAIRMGDESRHNSGNVLSVVNVPAQLTVMIMS